MLTLAVDQQASARTNSLLNSKASNFRLAKGQLSRLAPEELNVGPYLTRGSRSEGVEVRFLGPHENFCFGRLNLNLLGTDLS